MYWKLTEQIWWGDRHAVFELKNEVRSVLNLAHNSELAPGKTKYNPLVLDGTIPYFRLGARDRAFLPGNFLGELSTLLDICLLHTPTLIHCYLGQHRSPIVAVWGVVKQEEYSREVYENALARAIELRPDITPTLSYNYSKSVQGWIEQNIAYQAGKTTIS